MPTKAPAGTATVRPGEPPRSGPKATTEAWREYATSVGHTVPARLPRGHIIAMVDEGLSTEDGWHPLARDWYQSLAESGRQTFYEASDWETARILAELLSRALRSDKITAALIERWQAGATELLTTEGARRRVRVKLERQPPDEPVADVSELSEFRRRAQASGETAW